MSFLSPNFLIGSIKIGTIENASCFNIGNNFPSHFSSFQKLNQGFGSITGDHNDIQDIISRLDVRDLLDMYHEMSDEEFFTYVKRLLAQQQEVEEKNAAYSTNRNE